PDREGRMTMRPDTAARPWRKTIRAERKGTRTGRRHTHQPTPPRKDRPMPNATATLTVENVYADGTDTRTYPGVSLPLPVPADDDAREAWEQAHLFAYTGTGRED